MLSALGGVETGRPKFKAIPSYIVSLKLRWATRDSISKEKKLSNKQNKTTLQSPMDL